ncbi:MAG TPA: cell envelope integrity protein CreD [Flavobacteriaceae bacterium]|nr:cell envelope integrity protein CreD [Flavobacteriaceae bacterium]
MEQNKNKPACRQGRFGTWLRNSITARMLVVGFLLLVLLIPLESVKSLIRERAARQEKVTDEINQKWGNETTLSGPILKIPYKTYKEVRVYDEKAKKYFTENEVIVKNAYFFPENLNIVSKVETKPLQRGIYESVVYTANIHVTGNFPKIDSLKMEVPQEDILWEKATVLLRTSNLKGIRNALLVKVGIQELNMEMGTDYKNSLESGSIANFKEKSQISLPFSFNLKMNGSKSLMFVPIGKNTTAKMSSNWHSPSFDGQFLPKSRKVSPEGFEAAWQIFQINRQFGQSYFGELPNLWEHTFGTNFIIPVDEYQKTERAAKYGFMVIGLTLLVFLLIQLVSKIYIHPFQYAMIGLALVMFYTLLLSISEHGSFLGAYLIAAVSVLALIVLYSRTILKGNKFPLLVCGSLASLYLFIYVIIQLEDYALLVGSIGLFLILGIIMFVSRKIDWGLE